MSGLYTVYSFANVLECQKFIMSDTGLGTAVCQDFLIHSDHGIE